MLLEMQEISVEFPGVLAVDQVSISVAPGEVRSIVGENGAGKSTLVKVLAGVYPHGEYSGTIHLDGEAKQLAGVADNGELQADDPGDSVRPEGA